MDTALVAEEGPNGEAIREILNHYGVSYVDNPNGSGKFSTVIVPTREEARSKRAANSSLEESAIIIAQEVMDLELVVNGLSGQMPKIEGNLLEPLVSFEGLKLINALKLKLSDFRKPFSTKPMWPNPYRACCVVTHDIDWLSYSPFHSAVTRGNSLRRLIGLGVSYARGQDFGNNIPEIVTAERDNGIKSTFFFQTEYGEQNGKFDQGVESVRTAGFEIGLHAAHSSHTDQDSLSREIMVIEGKSKVPVRGVRVHILKFEVPRSWNLFDSERLTYDSTFSYNEKLGFRAGICFPYHPIDLATGKRLPILEIPMAFMDWTVLHEGLGKSGMLEALQKLMTSVERVGGCLVVNFHNTYLNERTFPDVSGVFKWLLGEGKSRGYWFATAGECADWWLARERPGKTALGDINAPVKSEAFT